MSFAGSLVDLLIRSSLLLAIIWLAAAYVRKAGGSAAMRHLIWLLGLVALPLLPLLSALVPPLPLPILPDLAAAPAPAEIAPAQAIVAAPPVAASAPVPASIGLGDALQLLYLSVAAGLLGRLALGYWLLARLWGRAQAPLEPRWAQLVDELAASLGIRRPVALRIAREPAMPMTWGSLRPRILLPAEAAGWTDERRRVVLLHELAHVARYDSPSRAAAAIVCALYWLHPAVWIAARRMRLEQEHACDDLVLSHGAKATAYARNLLDVASAARQPIVASLTVAMARTSELERRLTAIVRDGPRRPAGARFLAGSGTGALAATSLIAAMAPVAAVVPTAAVVPVAAVQPIAPVRSLAPVQPVAALPPALERSGEGQPSPGAPSSAASAPLATLATPTVPALPPIAPLPAQPAVPAVPAAPPSASADDYQGMRERHERELAVYHRQREIYDRARDAHHRQVAELRAQGNLANAGNSGNSGNWGNWGNPGRPARNGQPAIAPTPPTSPTAPTMPTPPTPIKRSSQGP